MGGLLKFGELWVEGRSRASALPTKGVALQLIIMDVLLIYVLSELVECGWKVTDAPIWTDRHRIRGCEQQIDFQIKKLREAIAL